MFTTLLASAALLASTALAQGAGSAVVVNQCSYPVSLTNVPASGGGQSQIGPNTLSTGGSYSQPWTQLSNGQGWSIKLTKDGEGTVLQYEYTFNNDGTIWYDLSAVNGDPFSGDWAFSATGDCSPRDAAYQYATDDAYGEQSCPADSTITVTLCPGGGGDVTPSQGASPTSAAVTSAVQTSSAYTPTSSVYSATTSLAVDNFGKDTKPTTFATLFAKTTTHVHTKVVTQYVTVSPSPVARYRHAERHEHA